MTFHTAARAFRAFDTAFYEITPAGRRRCIDAPARAEAWGRYIDGLCKDRVITRKQYESWGFPWDK